MSDSSKPNTIPDAYEFLRVIIDEESNWDELATNLKVIADSIDDSPIPASRKDHIKKLISRILNRFMALIVLSVIREDLRLYRTLTDFTNMQFNSSLIVAKKIHDQAQKKE